MSRPEWLGPVLLVTATIFIVLLIVAIVIGLSSINPSVTVDVNVNRRNPINVRNAALRNRPERNLRENANRVFGPGDTDPNDRRNFGREEVVVDRVPTRNVPVPNYSSRPLMKTYPVSNCCDSNWVDNDNVNVNGLNNLSSNILNNNFSNNGLNNLRNNIDYQAEKNDLEDGFVTKVIPLGNASVANDYFQYVEAGYVNPENLSYDAIANYSSDAVTEAEFHQQCTQACNQTDGCTGVIYDGSECILVNGEVVSNSSININPHQNSNLFMRDSQYLKFRNRVFVYPDETPSERYWNRGFSVNQNEVRLINFLPKSVINHSNLTGYWSNKNLSLHKAQYIHYPNEEFSLPDSMRNSTNFWVVYR